MFVRFISMLYVPGFVFLFSFRIPCMVLDNDPGRRDSLDSVHQSCTSTSFPRTILVVVGLGFKPWLSSCYNLAVHGGCLDHCMFVLFCSFLFYVWYGWEKGSRSLSERRPAFGSIRVYCYDLYTNQLFSYSSQGTLIVRGARSLSWASTKSRTID